MSGALPPPPPRHRSHSGGHPGRLILFGPICRAVTQQKVYLSPGESPRTITTSCLWALLWLRCTHLPGQSTGSDWHINSSSTPLSSCCVQNECNITALERLYRLISNGSSANGILPADVFWGGGVRPVKLAVHRKTSVLWGFQTHPLTPPLPSPLVFFPLNLNLLWSFLFLFTACALSLITRHPLCRHLEKGKWQQWYIFM